MPQIDKSWCFFSHQWTRGRFLQFSFSVTPNREQSAQCFHAWVWVPNIMYIKVCSCAGVVDVAFPVYDNDVSPVALTQSWHTAPPLQWRTSVLLGDIYILIGTFTQRESGQSNSRSTTIKKNNPGGLRIFYACNEPFLWFQVTAYHHKDYNNLWIVQRQNNNECK